MTFPTFTATLTDDLDILITCHEGYEIMDGTDIGSEKLVTCDCDTTVATLDSLACTGKNESELAK